MSRAWEWQQDPLFNDRIKLYCEGYEMGHIESDGDFMIQFIYGPLNNECKSFSSVNEAMNWHLEHAQEVYETTFPN